MSLVELLNLQLKVPLVLNMRTWERRLEKAKKGHRPSLKNWSRDGFATSRQRDFHKLREVSVAESRSKVVHPNFPMEEVLRIDAAHTTLEEFRDRFERPYLPCVIQNVPQLENWSAVSNWNIRDLKSRFKDRMLKVGEDDDGYKIKVKFRYFLQYLKHNTDDSPLYVFDGNYDDDPVSKALLDDYRVPSLFPDDLFRLVGEKRRPPYRWFLVGPERSGSTVHIDPLGTSAWNTLLQGRKRWVLFPPGAARDVVKGKTVIQKGEDDEAINYFVDLVPRIRSRYGHELGIYEFIQYPGETVFVPGGWWHAVLNLDDTIAITQNFCSTVNFDKVWRATRVGRKKMATSWLKRLRREYPEIAQRADALNENDGFEMYKSDPEKKRKKAEKKQKKAAAADAKRIQKHSVVQSDGTDNNSEDSSAA